MPSISDVAKLAGVSVTTVSRVINNSAHPVNQETRERVLKVAQELNFVPNALARALVSDSTHMIGVLVGDASDPYFATILRGISVMAREEGYLTMICNSDRLPEVELSYVQMMSNYHVDGILFTGGGLTDSSYIQEMRNLLADLQGRGVPVVLLGTHRFSAPQISIDNIQAAMDMTEYLISLGHKRIGFINGPDVLTTSALRLEGYCKALEKYGIPYDPGIVVSSEFTYEDGQRATDLILSCPEMPTAIFGSNDLTAIGCLSRLRERGIQVPEEISVAGFDDISAARYVNPPLTTIHVPMWDLGAAGMHHLLKLINKEEQAIQETLLLPYTLIERKSTAAIHDV
jgi:DNA-binding LacI/PurR family transcriptional regulator